MNEDVRKEAISGFVREYMNKIQQREIDQYDDSGLSITHHLWVDLRWFQSLADENGITWLHFVDWSQLQPMNLEALIEEGFVRFATGYKKKEDGVNRQFPQTAYIITIRGLKTLSNPGKYITPTPSAPNET